MSHVEAGALGITRKSYRRRLWAVRHARFFEIVYNLFEPVLELLAPLWRRIGPQRIEKPMMRVEKTIKSLLFDCRMCGQCVLSETGMSCPMNCPKSIRNGPCGGVRANGHCEVVPDMPCVWVQAWQGRQQMKRQQDQDARLKPLDHRKFNHSSWLEPALQRRQFIGPAGE